MAHGLLVKSTNAVIHVMKSFQQNKPGDSFVVFLTEGGVMETGQKEICVKKLVLWFQGQVASDGHLQCSGGFKKCGPQGIQNLAGFCHAIDVGCFDGTALFLKEHQAPQNFPVPPEIEFRGVLNESHVESPAMCLSVFHTICFDAVKRFESKQKCHFGSCRSLSKDKVQVKFADKSMLLREGM